MQISKHATVVKVLLCIPLVCAFAFCANNKSKSLQNVVKETSIPKTVAYDSLNGFVEYARNPFSGMDKLVSFVLANKPLSIWNLEKNDSLLYVKKKQNDTAQIHIVVQNPCWVVYKKNTKTATLAQRGFINGKPTLVVVEMQNVNLNKQIDTVGYLQSAQTTVAQAKANEFVLRVYLTEYGSNANGKLKPIRTYLVAPKQLKEKMQLCSHPKYDQQCVVVDKQNFDLYYFEKGKCVKKHKAGWGQNADGHKQVQGDNRTPEGEYFITKKVMGPFAGGGSEFLGYAYMELNYPNVIDAQKGLVAGKITQAEYARIVQANKVKTVVPKTTKLGGAVGLHGWINDFDEAGDLHMTYGCVSMLNKNMEWLYTKCKTGTKVYIY